jgi:hypothetical protein
VLIGSIPGVSPIRARRDNHDGIRIAVNVRVVDVGGVVSTTVFIRGMVDEGCLLGGLVEIGILGITGRVLLRQPAEHEPTHNAHADCHQEQQEYAPDVYSVPRWSRKST